MQPPGRDVTAVSWGNEPGIVKIASGHGWSWIHKHVMSLPDLVAI